MSSNDFERLTVLFCAMLGTFILARLIEKYINRPGAARRYMITDKEGNKLSFKILRSATEDERQRIFSEKTKEFDEMQTRREREASQPQAK